jgi:streptomycin 6-kinase
MASVIAQHACDKATTHAARLEQASTEFILLYVLTGNAGAGDLRGTEFCDAARAAETLLTNDCPQDQHRWLGAVHYDFVRKSPDGGLVDVDFSGRHRHGPAGRNPLLH